MDCSLPGSFVHGILQASWSELPDTSRVSFQPRDGSCISYISCNGRQVLSTSVTWEAPNIDYSGEMYYTCIIYSFTRWRGDISVGWKDTNATNLGAKQTVTYTWEDENAKGSGRPLIKVILLKKMSRNIWKAVNLIFIWKYFLQAYYFFISVSGSIHTKHNKALLI